MVARDETRRGAQQPDRTAGLTADATFEGFFHAEYGRLFTAMCGVTGSHEAEDITQEAFVRVLERWGTVGGMDDAGYLYRTAMNVFRSRYRRAKLAMRKAVRLTEQDDAFASVDTHADRSERSVSSTRASAPRSS